MGKDQELLEAARNGNVAVVEKILHQRAKRSGPLASLRRGPGANVQDSSGYTPLHHAALNGHKEIVQLLLEHEASPNVPDTKGSSPLHLAAWAGHTAIVRLLLTHGPALTNVNLTTRDNETALHCAAQYGHTAVVVMLLNHGADPTVRSARDETALDLASQYGRLETVELLVRTHPELLEPYRHPRGIFPHTPLHRASRNGHKAVVVVLLAAGHSPGARTPSGTALHEAALCGKSAAVRALLAGGADPRARDLRGATVLDVLAQFPERATHEIVALINKYRSSNGTDSSGEDLPPIPVAGDSPYDNVRPCAVLNPHPRRQPPPGVWERRGEDERRVSATSNISINVTSTSSPPKSFIPRSDQTSVSASKSKYTLLLPSNCFGLKNTSSSASVVSSNSIGYYKSSKLPKRVANQNMSKSTSNISTLRVGKSKFFRKKSSKSRSDEMILQDSISHASSAFSSDKKQNLGSNRKAPSLPNILESSEFPIDVLDSDGSSQSYESVTNPIYSHCGSVQDLLEVMKSHDQTGKDSSKSESKGFKLDSDEEDNARKELEEMSDMFDGAMGSPVESARSSFEFQKYTANEQIKITKKSNSVNDKRSPKKPLRLSHSNRTLRNWTLEQEDFKNSEPAYSPMALGSDENKIGLKPTNPLYYALLDFTTRANSYRNIEKDNHLYEPFDFKNNTNITPKAGYDSMVSPVHTTIRETRFKPIEVFDENGKVLREDNSLDKGDLPWEPIEDGVHAKVVCDNNSFDNKKDLRSEPPEDDVNAIVVCEDNSSDKRNSRCDPTGDEDFSDNLIIQPHSSEESLEELLTFRRDVQSRKPTPPPRPKALFPTRLSVGKSDTTSRSVSLCSTLDSRICESDESSSSRVRRNTISDVKNHFSNFSDVDFAGVDNNIPASVTSSKSVRISNTNSLDSYISDGASQRSSSNFGVENSYLPMNTVLEFSRELLKSSGSANDSFQVSTLRQVSDSGDPVYQNMIFVSDSSASTSEGRLSFTPPVSKTSVHVRGSENCIYTTPTDNEYIYALNPETVHDTHTEPFVRVPRCDPDKICFCEKGNRINADSVSDDTLSYRSSLTRSNEISGSRFICYCEDACCKSHHTKVAERSSLLAVSYTQLTHSVSFPNLQFSRAELDRNCSTMPPQFKRKPNMNAFNISFNTPLNDLPDDCLYDEVRSDLSKRDCDFSQDKRNSTTSSVSFHSVSDHSYVLPSSFQSSPFIVSPCIDVTPAPDSQQPLQDRGNTDESRRASSVSQYDSIVSSPRSTTFSAKSFEYTLYDVPNDQCVAVSDLSPKLTHHHSSSLTSDDYEDITLAPGVPGVRNSTASFMSFYSASDQPFSLPIDPSSNIIQEVPIAPSSDRCDLDRESRLVESCDVTSPEIVFNREPSLAESCDASILVNVIVASPCDCPTLVAKGGSRLCVHSGSDGGHFPYSKSQLMDGSYQSEELSSSYQSGRVREADQLSISSTTSSTGGPSPRERQRCGTNDSSVSGGNIYLPMATSGYHAHSPSSNNKVSPTPPKKPPRRNLSVSPTHLLPPLAFPGSAATQQSGQLARHQQTRSQDDLDDFQAPGSKLTGLRHGRSVDQYVDNDLKTSPRARPIPQPRPSLALLAASRKEQPIAISTMYENVVIKEQNPRRKLRRNPTNQYENYNPKELNNVGAQDEESLLANKTQRYNSSQERSSLESLLDDVGSFTPSDVESRTCKSRPTIQTPLSPTHYDQPPTPDHPPPSAKQAEISIHERMRPLSQEYKRMSRDMETETDPRLLGRCTSPSSSASTDHCVEEYVAEVPFAGLFKGSTTTLDGVGQRPTPAERPKSLRTLKSVYDGGGLSTNQGNQQTSNNLSHSYQGYHPITNNSHANLSQSYHGSQNNQNNLNQTFRGSQTNRNSNQPYYGGQVNQSSQASLIDRGSSKTEFEDPWQYRSGRDPKEQLRESGTTQTSGGLERSLSILSPFDEEEEWAKISEIMASFGTRPVRESVFSEDLEREFQSRLGLAGAMARKSPSPAPEQMLARPETVGAWLTSIGLGNLEATLVGNGYDELDFVNGVIEENDFSEMAVEDPDKTKILEASKSLPLKIDEVMSLPPTVDNHNNNITNKTDEKDVDPEEVNKWLKSIGLECYQDTFRRHLYADMERVRRIWEVELTAVLEIQKVGHRRRILASVAGRQNGPATNMEDIKADLNNLILEIMSLADKPSVEQKNLQNLKAEIKDIPSVDTMSNPPIQIPTSQLQQKSPAIQNQTSTLTKSNQSSGDQNQNSGTLKSTASSQGSTGPTLVPPGGETLKRSHKKNRPPPPPTARGADLEIRAPCELLVGVPGALKTQWRHQPFVLVTSSVMYVANYLGSTVVRELRGTESTQKSIQKLKKTNSEPRALPDIILSISYRGVKFLNTITRELVCEHEIRNIHCACQDADDLTHFAYITKDITTKSHYCHVFCVATMDQATEVILTLGQAFEVAYQMALRDLAPKTNPAPAQQQIRSQSSNQITAQQSKTPTHEKPSNQISKDKNIQAHGRSHSVTEIKLNGHQLKVAPMTVSLSNEEFQTSGKNGDVQRSPRTPSAKAPIAVAEEL